MGRLRSLKISTGTLGEKKANVKRISLFLQESYPLLLYVKLLSPKSPLHLIVTSAISTQTLAEFQPALRRSAAFGRGPLFCQD